MKPIRGLSVATVLILVLPAMALAGSGGEEELEALHQTNFDAGSINIDNPWFPLKPGTQLVYEGSTHEDGESVPHRVVFIVTDLTKMINGVRTVVIFDRDYSAGRLVESELTCFAQDKAGNVWHLGQYSEVYSETEFVGGRAWFDGYVDGARAGIMMQADPRPGTPSYSQGYAPAPYNWTDRGRVSKAGQQVSVPAGSYEDVLVIEEFNQEEPDAIQLKYHVRGVGVVQIGWKGEDESQETLSLTKREQLDPEALARARAKALQLETRAYVYGKTAPAEPRESLD